MNITIDKNTYLGSISGKNCRNKNDALKEIGKAFLFPDYYGLNLDALYDCFTDLSWIDYKKVVFVINDFELFLSDESINLKNSFFELFEDVRIEWSENDKIFKFFKTVGGSVPN